MFPALLSATGMSRRVQPTILRQGVHYLTRKTAIPVREIFRRDHEAE